MKIKLAGKFNGDMASLPHGEHQEGAVAFKEAQDVKIFSIVMNIVSVIILLPLMIFVFYYGEYHSLQVFLGALASCLALIPHEFLHAICFKEEVFIYHYLSKGMLFVIGNECMSKGRFIFMSLFPNIVFGFIPFVIFCLKPEWIFLGVFGAISIGCGVGDYYNVFNAMTQMPKGAYTYLYQFHSYWYIPK